MAIPLKCIEVSEALFDEILTKMASRVEYVENFNDFVHGYKNKKIIKTNGQSLIIQEYLFAHFANIPMDQEVSDWKQVKVRKSDALCGTTTTFEESIDGPRAYNYMMRLLHKHYTDDEIQERFSLFEADYDYNLKQFHYEYPSAHDIVLAHDNCIKYDINGAHQWALIEIFPKAEEDIRDIYRLRKTNPKYKKYINFFVGMFCKKEHRRTYNWIIQKITKKLFKAYDYCQGDLVYANTDGIMLKNCKRRLTHSTELGEFKLEYEGTVYTHQDTNWWCYELDNPADAKDKIKGSVRYQVRHLIDLKNGIVPKYTINREYLGLDEKGNKTYKPDEIVNIRTEKVNVCKED